MFYFWNGKDKIQLTLANSYYLCENEILVISEKIKFVLFPISSSGMSFDLALLQRQDDCEIILLKTWTSQTLPLFALHNLREDLKLETDKVGGQVRGEEEELLRRVFLSFVPDWCCLS